MCRLGFFCAPCVRQLSASRVASIHSGAALVVFSPWSCAALQDRSCASSRDGPIGGGGIKIAGREIILDRGDTTLYPCIEEASNDEDIVVISKDDTVAMREICFLVEDNGTFMSMG